MPKPRRKGNEITMLAAALAAAGTRPLNEETMTEVYGYSDDTICFGGDFEGQIGCFGTDEQEHGVLVVMSDGTVLEVKYCGRVPGVWEVKLVRKGELFIAIDMCNGEDADPYSDVAWFQPGIKWACAAREWENVK